MLNLRTKSDLQRLVDERLEESLTLDYKDSRALSRDGKGPDELCKDVSALANSAGGQLVYGIEEDKTTKRPFSVDDGVVDCKISREWIEQVLNSRIEPRINGIQITRIDMENGKFGYVISVPQSQIGPHQAPDRKYYKRFDLQSVPMYDYEIKDILRRSTTPHLVVSFEFISGERTQFNLEQGTQHSMPVYLKGTISNLSSQPASYVLVRIGISASISLVRNGPWTYAGPEETEDFGKLDWQYQYIGAPPDFPVFKELNRSLDNGGIGTMFSDRTLGNSHRYPVVIEVHTPGFYSREAWYIQQQGTNLRLLHPGHPLSK